MPWLKMDDNFITNPKLLGIGKDSKLLYFWSLGFAAKELTDGFISKKYLMNIAGLAGIDGLQDAISELLDARLWEPAEGGYCIHDFLEYNPTAEQVRKERQEAKERMQRLRSGEVRANTERTQPEVRVTLIDPVPDPVPVPIPRSGGSHGETVVSQRTPSKPPKPNGKAPKLEAVPKTQRETDREALVDELSAAFRPWVGNERGLYRNTALKILEAGGRPGENIVRRMIQVHEDRWKKTATVASIGQYSVQLIRAIGPPKADEDRQWQAELDDLQFWDTFTVEQWAEEEAADPEWAADRRRRLEEWRNAGRPRARASPGR